MAWSTALKLVTLLLVLNIFFYTCEAQNVQCKNEKGKSVDWFILYKLPVIQKTTNYLLRKGFAYAYITSENENADWTLSDISINDTKSMPSQTLDHLYTYDDKIMRVLYNDEPPSASASLSFGHTKGTIMGDENGAFWMIHSVPKFPIEPCSVIKQNKTSTIQEPRCTKNKYLYPETAKRFGQTFLCISLPLTELNNLGSQLKFNKPKIYSANVPTNFLKYTEFVEAANSKYVKTPPWNRLSNLTSIHGTKFTNFAKTAKFGKELYSDWVAPQFKESLNVETWSNGANDFPSECTKPFQILDVKQVGFNFKSTNVLFKNSQDHSKWAVSLDKSKPWLCIGDINRMAAQLKRGGGTTCFENLSIWSKFSKMVREIEPCPIHKPGLTQ